MTLPIPTAGNGEYLYRCNGEPTAVHETFEVSHGSPGGRLGHDDGTRRPAVYVQSERTAPGGVQLRVSVELGDTRNARCELSYRDDSGANRRCFYTIVDGSLEVTSEPAPGVAATSEPVRCGPLPSDAPGPPSPPASVLSPLLRVFQGPAIAALIGAGGHGTVIVPALDPDVVDTLLSPTVQTRNAAELEPGPLRRCSYEGGNYDDAAEFWLDESDRLVRYLFPQSPTQLWEVTLTGS